MPDHSTEYRGRPASRLKSWFGCRDPSRVLQAAEVFLRGAWPEGGAAVSVAGDRR